jgi:hypothetical protein
LQVTASGIKNAFPPSLLTWFDQIDRILYASRSPLNWLTKRRRMLIKRRKPNGSRTTTLHNHSGIGEITLAEKIEDVDVKVYCSDDTIVKFE